MHDDVSELDGILRLREKFRNFTELYNGYDGVNPVLFGLPILRFVVLLYIPIPHLFRPFTV